MTMNPLRLQNVRVVPQCMPRPPRPATARVAQVILVTEMASNTLERYVEKRTQHVLPCACTVSLLTLFFQTVGSISFRELVYIMKGVLVALIFLHKRDGTCVTQC